MSRIPTVTIQQAFELALQHHQLGRLKEAEAIYRQILAAEPRHANSMHLLGVISYQTGRNDVAVKLICQAISLAPGVPDFHANLGEALRAGGQLDEAIAAYRQAIALKPNFTEAHSNLGVALRDKGQLDEAIAAFRQAIALNPGFAQTHSNLGNALHERGHLDEAIAAYRQAIALHPNFHQAHSNLGNALYEKGQLEEAMAACRQAIAITPGFHQAHSNLGNALLQTGRIDEAIAAYRQAISLHPDSSEAYNNLGNALMDKRQPDEAIAAFREAIAHNPNYAEAFSNLGAAHKSIGQLDEAIAAFDQAIQLKPGYSDAGSNLVLTMNYHPGFDAQAIAGAQRRWNQQHAEPLRQFIQFHPNERTPGRRLRIGYVSPDFREHPVGYNMLPLLGRHDHEAVEVFCYSHVPQPDALTDRFRACADHWRSTVGLADEKLADQIRRDGIDILVDLALHTACNRLPVFARKPAPVQVTFAGYPGSTGLETMDYRLSDPYLDPPGTDESIYSEQTVRLPHTFWCYDPLDGRDLPVNALPAQSNGHVTFGCLNNFCKVNAPVLKLWAKVLQAVPSSRLLLLVPDGSQRHRILDLLQQEGIAHERLGFFSRQPRRKYLELYHRIDLGLDTLPYNGHTTSLDSYWMGVPVVTLVGDTIVGRAGLCQLVNLDLPECIASTPGQYVQIAAGLAGDLPRLARLRGSLRPRMEASPLMDASRFARDIEAAYRAMWRAWCSRAGNEPTVAGASGP
jgi:predicted O-linked N-acetylglucosamine transferase (SPINDLY family)